MNHGSYLRSFDVRLLFLGHVVVLQVLCPTRSPAHQPAYMWARLSIFRPPRLSAPNSLGYTRNDLGLPA